jgi:hypothetical protein
MATCLVATPCGLGFLSSWTQQREKYVEILFRFVVVNASGVRQRKIEGSVRRQGRCILEIFVGVVESFIMSSVPGMQVIQLTELAEQDSRRVAVLLLCKLVNSSANLSPRVYPVITLAVLIKGLYLDS